MTNHTLPIRLLKTPDHQLEIEWDDGVVQLIPFRKLRESCRCAVCNAKREKEGGVKEDSELTERPKLGSLKVISAAEARPLDIQKMHPVGNYAYSIHFSDGHSSGIFTFEMLRNLDEE